MLSGAFFAHGSKNKVKPMNKTHNKDETSSFHGKMIQKMLYLEYKLQQECCRIACECERKLTMRNKIRRLIAVLMLVGVLACSALSASAAVRSPRKNLRMKFSCIDEEATVEIDDGRVPL